MKSGIIVVFLLLLSPYKLAAQSTPPVVRFVVLDDYIRTQLAADWDAHQSDSPGPERGYCLGYQLDFWAGEVAYRVTQIATPDSVVAGVTSISFSCVGKFAGRVAELHVHPPHSCLGPYGPCFLNGPYAFQCEPSDSDRMWLERMRQPFAMIQCARDATIYYLLR